MYEQRYGYLGTARKRDRMEKKKIHKYIPVLVEKNKNELDVPFQFLVDLITEANDVLPILLPVCWMGGFICYRKTIAPTKHMPLRSIFYQ